jgi:hypothetical protein
MAHHRHGRGKDDDAPFDGGPFALLEQPAGLLLLVGPTRFPRSTPRASRYFNQMMADSFR